MAGDLDPAVEGLVGVLGHRPDVPPRRVHPELAAGGVDDRPGGAVVVGVGVGADDEADVAQLQLRLPERELELVQPLLAADPGVEEDDAVAARDRPRVDVRDARPRARQPQPPDARKGPLAAGHLVAPVGAHGGEPIPLRARAGWRPPPV